MAGVRAARLRQAGANGRKGRPFWSGWQAKTRRTLRGGVTLW